MSWSPEQLREFERTAPSDASDALMDQWVAYLLSPQPRQEAPEVWDGVEHEFEGVAPSADAARQALIGSGDTWLPVARPELHPMHVTNSPDHMNGNNLHTAYHKLGGRHRRVGARGEEKHHHHRDGV